MLSMERDGNLSHLFMAEATATLNTKAIACALRQTPQLHLSVSALTTAVRLPIGSNNSRQKYTILLELRWLDTR